MKKIRPVFISILVLLLFCSCTAPKDQNETQTTLSEIVQTTYTTNAPEQTTEPATTEADTTTAVTTTAQTTTAKATILEAAKAEKATTLPTTKKVVTEEAKPKETKPQTATTAKQTTKPLPKPTTTKPPKTTAPKTEPTATTAKPTTITEAASTTQNTGNYCTIAIDIRNIKNNIGSLKSEKKPFVTSDRYILKTTKVTFSKGDTAFDILKKACKENPCSDNCRYCKNGIQLESVFTPAFQSYYVEGIHQLYEKDCGSMSGWMYSVNGKFPDVSSSAYEVKNGDSIVFAYTCDMGEDLGQSY